MFHSPARSSMARPHFVTRILIKPSAQGLAILGSVLVALSFVPASAQTSVFNCSGFNANTSGLCSVSQASGVTGQRFIVRNYATPINNPPQIQMLPPNAGHNGFGLAYYAPVTITAFTTTVAFIPNGQNLAFVVQNTTNNPGYTGNIFSSGAGCEGGFYQGSVASGAYSPDALFALQIVDAQ